MTAEMLPEQSLPHVTIAGLNHIRVETLVAITNQLHDGAKLWRYGNATRSELLQFAEFFEAEVRRRDSAAAARLAAVRAGRSARSEKGAAQ